MLNKQTLSQIKTKCQNFKGKHFQKINLTLTKIVIISVIIVLCLYYGLIGALLNSEIRKDINIKPQPVSGLHTNGVASFIIKQEVHNNLWTPNLPFFFPTYFIDNLPNFQLGEIKAVSVVINALSSLARLDANYQKAAELLSYDGRIWMFEKGGVLPVPSAASQYKKGNVLLKKSALVANGFVLDNASLLFVLNKISKSLSSSQEQIYNTIIKDENVDDAFYYNQGKIYAYALFLRAISKDYQPVFEKLGLRSSMSSVVKSLENGSQISPFMVKNKDKSSSSANHLYNLGYYLQHAIIKLNTIEERLKNEL